MFTGIIEATATVRKIHLHGNEAVLELSNPFGMQLRNGCSVAVDGMCLTVTSFDKEKMVFFVSYASLEKTRARIYQAGTRVNLEQALKADGRLDGHIVTGHVDTVGVIEKRVKRGGAEEIDIRFPAEFNDLVVERGSVAVNGISLTVADRTSSRFKVAMIPETKDRTTFRDGLSAGEKVNIEFDIIGKYIVRKSSLYNSDLGKVLDHL